MTALTERIASLSPERRQLLETLRRERQGTRPAPSPEPVRTAAPFSLLSPEDRLKLPEGLEDAYPLSMVQLGMLYHMELTPDAATPAYHNVNGWHLRAPFDLACFVEATRRAVARHPILRTSFDLTGYSEPIQLVHRHAELPIAVVDLRELEWEEQQRVFDRFVQEENRQVFDISGAPMMRFHVHRRTDESFQFTLSEPHSISDGWSTTSTLAEIFGDYFALMRGEDLPPRPPLAVGYRDFVRAEREALQSPEHRRFWEGKLAGFTASPLPRWPLPEPWKPARSRKPYLTVPGEVVEGLQRLAREAGAPLKTVTLAAHLKVLSLVSGEPDVVTGLVANGRLEDLDGDQVRGLFLNTIPFRMVLREEDSWVDLVRRTFAGETELLAYRRYPVPALQRTWGRRPLFESFFTFLHFHSLEGVLRSGNLRFLGGHTDLSVTHYPIAAMFRLNPVVASHLTLFLEFDDHQFSENQVAAIQRHFDGVLRDMATQPRRAHTAQLPLSEVERQQLLREWNDAPGVPLPAGGLHHLFAARASEAPDAVAVRHGGRQLTYAELDRCSNRLARRLRRAGAGPEVRVGVCLDRTLELVVSLLAILKAASAYVPLDPAYPKDRLRFMLEDSGAEILLTRSTLQESLPETAARKLLLDAEREAIEAESDDSLPGEGLGSLLAYVIYTSGSTGRPKGVAVEHRAVLALLGWARRAFSPEELAGTVASTSICFDLSVFELFVPLCRGGQVILVESGLHLTQLPPGANVTLINTVPSVLAELLAAGALPPTLRTVNLAGEALPGRLAEEIRNAGVPRLLNLYGPSEDTVYSTMAQIEAGAGERPLIGRPLDGKKALILDRFLQPVPVMAPGELFVGGPGLARGYLRRPDLTAERFVPDPFGKEPGARLYRTGDRASRTLTGDVDFLGRLDQQVKIRGFRIEPGEVDQALARHPHVREVVVVPLADGEGRLRLVAYLAGEPERLMPAELRELLRERLPDYMVPSQFVCLAALPRNPSGKVDRAALPAPEGLGLGAREEYAEPRTLLERQVADIWRELLGVERVGLHDNFFDLGGHSLLLLRLHRRLQQELDRRVAVTDLFRHPTVQSLAACLSGESAEDLPAQGKERAESRLEARQRQTRGFQARQAVRAGGRGTAPGPERSS